MQTMRKYPFLDEHVRRSLLVGVIGWILLLTVLLFATRSAGAAEPVPAIAATSTGSAGNGEARLAVLPEAGIDLAAYFD